MTATADSPKPSVVSDATVTMLGGSAVFVNKKTVVRAAEGSVFAFYVSTRAVASIVVSSGSVTAAAPGGAETALIPAVPFLLK